jgi:hypothetical protein
VKKTNTIPAAPPQAPDKVPATSMLASTASATAEHLSSFKKAPKQLARQALQKITNQADEAATVGRKDKVKFWLENYIAKNPLNKFYLLSWLLVVVIFVHAILFIKTSHGIDYASTSGTDPMDFVQSLYYMAQTVITGGYDTYLQGYSKVVYMSAFLTGIFLFAVLVGLVDEYILHAMAVISEGKTKVACEGHTVILGWNESTVRCVCQLAFLRRKFLMQNEKCHRRFLPCLRVPPATPVASAKIVILCDKKSKEEMDYVLREALLERGISPKRTCVGTDVLCRVGNPTEPHDLLRVGVHRATAVLTMMTEADDDEEKATDGSIKNGHSLKTLLAVKHVVSTHNPPSHKKFWNAFRLVLHLDSESPTITAAMFTAPDGTPEGRPCVRAVNLQALMNSMMFSTGLNPALPSVMLELINFEGIAFRARDAKDLKLVGRTVRDCSLIWEDGVFAGVVSKSVHLDEVTPHFHQGLACDPDRVVEVDDRVIFISASTVPRQRRKPLAPKLLPKIGRAPKRQFNTLVCGWRKVWKDGHRLYLRLLLLVRGASEGNTVVFLNMNTEEQFAEVINSAKHKDGSACFQRKDNVWELEGVTIKHVHGDPGDALTLRNAMIQTNFEVAIVLGTSAKELPKNSQDLRMLSIYVLVHKIHQEVRDDAPLHCIGENIFDSTRELAHAVTCKESTKDMVNTQAMYARGLIQALAFPLMQPAVAQMFHDTDGSPKLKMFRIGHAVIPCGQATFADVTHTIAQNQDMVGAICVGFVINGETIIAPPPSKVFDLQEGDVLVVIERS